MNHSISAMKEPLVFLDDKRKEIRTTGYAFIDEWGHTIIIVYGEGRRDDMSRYLNADGDVLNIKYKCYEINGK
jgi:hypothetical protein